MREIRDDKSGFLKINEIILSIDHDKDLFKKLGKKIAEFSYDRKSLKRNYYSNKRQNSESMLCDSKPCLKVVLNEGIEGLSETRNVGINTATGDIIAFIDDDAVAKADWLENLVNPFREGNIMAVGGMALPVWPQDKCPFWFPAR